MLAFYNGTIGIFVTVEKSRRHSLLNLLASIGVGVKTSRRSLCALVVPNERSRVTTTYPCSSSAPLLFHTTSTFCWFCRYNGNPKHTREQWCTRSNQTEPTKDATLYSIYNEKTRYLRQNETQTLFYWK